MTDTLVVKRGLVLPSVLSSFTPHVFVKHIARLPAHPPKKPQTNPFSQCGFLVDVLAQLKS